MKKVLLIALTVFLASACHNDNGPCPTCPPPYAQTILLDTLSVEPTAVVFQVRTTDSTHLGVVQLYRDSTSVFKGAILSIDTTIIDPTLSPEHQYRYKAYRLTDNSPTDSSAAIVLTTMDTSSSSFSWDVTTLGNDVSHGFADVAIVNDTCVWAVGEIYNYDSAAQVDPTLYNAARWNGQAWGLTQIYYPYQGQNYIAPLYSIFVFSSTDLWVGSNQPMHWTGTSWETFDLPASVWNGWINKIWGRTSSDLYIVGNNGAIAHYSNGGWQKLESGTTLDTQDIWGSTNDKTGELEIMAVASLPYTGYNRTILKISGSTVTNLSDSGVYTALTGAWFQAGRKYYVVGDSIYSRRPLLNSNTWSKDIASYFMNTNPWAIRGLGLNDIVVGSSEGDILHFDGSSWRRYFPSASGLYHSIAIRGNLVVAVGGDINELGIIAIGRR